MTPSQATEMGYERASKYPKSTKYGRQNPISERWNSEEQLLIWREAWADTVNQALESMRFTERIDHRSHAERGIDEQPTIHEGVAAQAIEQRNARDGTAATAATTVIADRRELNRQIKADNALLRELKAQVSRLKRTIAESIPAMAEALETLRDRIILLQYQFSHNSYQIGQIKRTVDYIAPLLQEYQRLYNSIHEKQAEKRTLEAERKTCGTFKVAQRIALSRQITTLTEDIEELKSQKTQLLVQMKCPDDDTTGEKERDIAEFEKVQEALEKEQISLSSQAKEAAREYVKAEQQVPDERWNQVCKQRRLIFMDHWEALMHKLHDIYGQMFSHQLFRDVQDYVNEHVPERRETKNGNTERF